jgi:hypothetical protein
VHWLSGCRVFPIHPPRKRSGGLFVFPFESTKVDLSIAQVERGRRCFVDDEELKADNTDLLETGIAVGQINALGLIAGRCSAAQAERIRRLREHKIYKRCTEKWEDFCAKYLKMSRAEADRTIKLLQEFGPAYFELSQLTRVSPETYRAIAPHIQNRVLHHKGEAIELNVDNSQKLAAAVAEIRGAIPKNTSGLSQELNDLSQERDVQQRIDRLVQCCFKILAEFENIARAETLGATRGYLQNTLAQVRDEIIRLARESGL